MDRVDFPFPLSELTLENVNSMAQTFFQGVQQDRYSGLTITNFGLTHPVKNLAEILHVVLETCLPLSSKITYLWLHSGFGNVNNSIIFQEFLASPQSSLYSLILTQLVTMTLEEAQHFHNGLASNKTLQTLHIADDTLDPTSAIQNKLLSALIKRESCLKELTLQPCHIGKSLSKVIENGKCPHKLDLLGQIPDEEFIHVLADYTSLPSCHLTRLAFSNTAIPNFEVLCNALQVNQSLTSLSFTLQNYNAVQQFAPRLGSHKTLTSLEISSNYLGDDFIEEFCSHWHCDSNLESLDFQRNLIGPNGGTILIHAIANHPKMKNLNLSGNQTLGFEGLAVIARELPSLSLLSIDLHGCTMFQTRNGFDDDARVASDSAGQALLEGIQANAFLQEMHLYSNGLDDAVCKKIAFWESLNQQIVTWGSPTQAKAQQCPTGFDFALDSKIDTCVSLNQQIGAFLSTAQAQPISAWCNIYSKLSPSPTRVFIVLQQQPHVLSSTH